MTQLIMASDMIKRCKKCKIKKHSSKFYKHPSTKDKLSNICIDCQLQYQKKNIKNKRINNLKTHHKAKKRGKNLILQYLKSHPCIDCEESDPIVLEFDHIRGRKKFCISQRIHYVWETLLKEIEKCDIRCANCHRRRHYKNSYKDI